MALVLSFWPGLNFPIDFFPRRPRLFNQATSFPVKPPISARSDRRLRAPTPDDSHQYRCEKGEPDVYVGVLYEKAAPYRHTERRDVQYGARGRQCQDQQSRRPVHGPFGTVEPGQPLRPDYISAARWCSLWPRVSR